MYPTSGGHRCPKHVLKRGDGGGEDFPRSPGSASDGRLRIATLTPKGRALHDQILDIALERERALLTVLSASKRETLLRLLKRVHENLPAVEAATTAYV